MLFFSSRKVFFSLINSFFFSIWTAKTIQISKKKELIAEKKKFLSEKKLRIRAFPFQCNAFQATKKIYSLNVESQNKHRENIFSLLNHLKMCFQLSFPLDFELRKKKYFGSMNHFHFYVSSRIAFPLNDKTNIKSILTSQEPKKSKPFIFQIKSLTDRH